MEIIKNSDYFAAQLSANNTNGNNVIINQLISEMIIYAKQLEDNQIPLGNSRPQKTKPDGNLKSPDFEAVINMNSDSINTNLLTILQDFLTYIKMLENTIHS